MTDNLNQKPKRGFASLSPEKLREIASRGGKSVPPEKRSFSRDKTLASEAGRIGGGAVPPSKRTFAVDKDSAIRAGSKGGTNSQAKRSKQDDGHSD